MGTTGVRASFTCVSHRLVSLSLIAFVSHRGWAAGIRAAAAYEVRTAATSALTEGQEVRNTVVWLSGVDGDGG